MNQLIPKFYSGNEPHNLFVEVSFVLSAEKTENCHIYKCFGVLLEESDDLIRVMFSSENKVLNDYRDIKTEDILNIKAVDPDNIEVIN